MIAFLCADVPFTSPDTTLCTKVLGCDGLPAADMSGFSDPYVVVMWDDHFVGRTRIQNMTLNPRWDRETFVVPVDDGFVRALEVTPRV